MRRSGLIGGMVGLQDAAAGPMAMMLTTARRDCAADLVMSPLEFMQRRARWHRNRVRIRAVVAVNGSFGGIESRGPKFRFWPTAAAAKSRL